MILQGDALTVLRTLPDESVQCCVTSPPYWGLRDYGVPGQLGLEKTPTEYVEKLAAIFGEVRRVLRNDGVIFLNLGDSYATGGGRSVGRNDSGKEIMGRAVSSKTGGATGRPTVAGLKDKDLVGIPWTVAFALRADGWYLRSDIIWSKPNPMPESVTDRPTKSHEYVFLLTKAASYYFDQEAVREAARDWGLRDRADWRGKVNTPGNPQNGCTDANHAANGRNIRSVWTIATSPFPEAHFATFPPELAMRCIKAGSARSDTVLDPFFGAGTVGLVAESLGRKWIGIELNPKYVAMADRRIRGPLFAGMGV